jgi:hypothetical protein
LVWTSFFSSFQADHIALPAAFKVALSDLSQSFGRIHDALAKLPPTERKAVAEEIEFQFQVGYCC